MLRHLRIRQATIRDAQTLAKMGERTFRHTYHQFNTPENIDTYVKENFSLIQITKELQSPTNIFLLADMGSEAIGYVKLRDNKLTDAVELPAAVELERIYVERNFQGKGLGSYLMQAALEEAARAGYQSIWLGVWEMNKLAIRFYAKWNFEVVGTHVFVLGADKQTDLVMARPLTLSHV